MVNGGNKLALAIRLVGESGLEIEFLHWDNRFLSDYDKDNPKNDRFVYFESKDGLFCIYSHDEGYIIDEGQFGFIVPDKDNMKPGYIMTHEFTDDNMRYSFVKSMFEYLPEWAECWDSFKNDQKPTHEFIVHDQYWVY